jgi:hypothetical protein
MRADLPTHDYSARRWLLEESLDGGLSLTGSYQILGGAIPEEKADRFHEHGFAGAGFAREDVKARLKLDRDGFDNRKVVDDEVAEHVKGEERCAKPRTPILPYV